MKIKTIAALVFAAGNRLALTRINQPVDDWKPSPSNMPGQQYPE